MHPTARYVWQQKGWPHWRWDAGRLLAPLSQARLAQGKLLGKVAGLGFDLGLKVRAEVLAEETLQTAAIEGQRLSPESVRSSVARRLGLPTAGLRPVERPVDGLVQMLLDATTRHGLPLTAKRLQGWQAALFPTGFSGLQRVRVGAWRKGPMQVVSGPVGREKEHFEAPPANRLEVEVRQYLEWFAASRGTIDGLVRAGLAHLWLVTIHPFEDGNGRVARAVADMALAQDEASETRLYSMSAQIDAERDEYYAVLERTQRGDLDSTEWMSWFLRCLERAVGGSHTHVEKALSKARFWQAHLALELSERQRKAINRLLDAGRGGFEGGLTTRKYVGMTRASRATAQRELAELVEQGILRHRPGAGRSTSYELAWDAA
jgi:Fic family protein